MNLFRIFGILVIAGLILMPGWLEAEEAAAPAAEAEAPAAADVPALPDIENLDFASGEVVGFDAATGKLDVKVYLDAAGNASEQTLSFTVAADTEITNGETTLKTDALKAGAEVDVEYDTEAQKATYIFVY